MDGLVNYYQSLSPVEQAEFLQNLPPETRADLVKRVTEIIKKKHEEEAAAAKKAEEDAKKKAEEDAKKKAEEDAKKTGNTGGGMSISSLQPDEKRVYVIMKGRLENYRFTKVREINPHVWVGQVVFVPHPTLANAQVGQNVLVHIWDIGNLSMQEMQVAMQHNIVVSNQEENLQTLRIGSWNIRCTGEFQRNNVFFPELLERFGRLAAFIHKSNCDIVALQEFPLNFNHAQSKLEIPAHVLIPEFIIKLNEISKHDEWDFGYSEDFPQDCWEENRNVKNASGNPVDEYPKENGQYIHAFIFKKSKIVMHSVEQVLDIVHQENRFKHAPSLGRFTFMKNFHFSLCNVHLRPYVDDTNNAKYEIEDLGRCIDKMSKYNPNSTIILGDFNMSAARFAPVGSNDRRKQTEFLPHLDGVWESFRTKSYFEAIKNRYTNTADVDDPNTKSKANPRQYDNIWLPAELESNFNRAVKETMVYKANKDPYKQTENVLRLQDVFVGGHGNNQVITDITDHHLVFVDLEIDVAQRNDFIKKVFEINDSINDLKPREYTGFNEPKKPVPPPEPLFPEKKEPVPPPPPPPPPELIDEFVTPHKPDKPHNKGKGEKTASGKVSPVTMKPPSPVDKGGGGGLGAARKHFNVWDKRYGPNPTVENMGGRSEVEFWSNSLFPRNLVLSEKEINNQMRELETEYTDHVKELEELESDIEEIKSKAGEHGQIKRLRDARRKGRELIARIKEILLQFENLANLHYPGHVKK